MWHDAEFGVVLAAKGRHEIVAQDAYKAHLAVLAKRARQPRPPRIQALLKEARVLKARLVSDPNLTQKALAREIGINPAQLMRLLRLADLAPEIQQHILSLPPSIHRGLVTERRLRPISRIADREEQLHAFRRLLAPKPDQGNLPGAPYSSQPS